jgi:dipeptidase D
LKKKKKVHNLYINLNYSYLCTLIKKTIMSQAVRDLEPKQLWNKFADLNAVPRPSKKEERVIAFMVEFGKNLGLDVVIDPVQNVIIKKPATAGMEDRKTIVMQSHLDMVHQKNNETDFDFDSEGIKMKIEGDWVKAEGTTLGADNGLGVATIMAILESTDIPHPAIEALFTIDEETGMTGALGLQGGYLTGEILLNLDTEDDDEFSIGCAGGVDMTVTRAYTQEQINGISLKITVKGLQGGHSGMQIHEGLGNANKLMNRVFYATQNYMQIATVMGGGLRNAIPRESNSVIVTEDIENFNTAFEGIKNEIIAEFKTIEPDLVILLQGTEDASAVMSRNDQKAFIGAVYAAHNGVFRMSPDIKDLVETSNNVARVEAKEGKMEVLCLTRSSVESGKWNMANNLSSTFELAGFSIETGGDYPGWKPNRDSEILTVLEEKYEALFNEKPRVMACHAGLECGILGTNYPEMDMISFGPTIKGAHSPDERASISSAQKYWKFTLEVLKAIPLKA